jgi:hypothetical protein
VKRLISLIVLGAFLCCSTAMASEIRCGAAVADLPFKDGRATAETAQALREELLYERAVQAYLWALPLINTLGMKNGSEKTFGAGYNVLPIWKERLDAKTLVTTPNVDVLYAMSYVDLGKDGPLVFEAPPNLQGILMDVWQRPIPVDGGKYFGDVGLPGPDHGKGGKILLLPPGYKGEVPDGYFIYRSATNTVFIFLRAFFDDPRNLAPTVALLERTKLYPLGGKQAAKPMVFPDASGVAVDMLPRRDGGVFNDLKSLVDNEIPGIAEPDSLALLAAIGIVKGNPFAPDAQTRAILDRAARNAYKISRVVGFEDTVSGQSFRLYADRHWLNPMAGHHADNTQPASAAHGSEIPDLDARIWFFTNYYSMSPGMASNTPGVGAKYLIAFSDGDGAPLSGGRSYRLRLPADIPAANFWSVTLYDAANGSGLDNGQPFPSLGSRDHPVTAPNGDTELVLSPQAPENGKANWLRTVLGKDFFVILRLYGPTKAALDNTWKPGDLEPIP